MDSRFDGKRCQNDSGKLKLTAYSSSKDDAKGFKLTCEDCGSVFIHAVHNSATDTDEEIKQKLLGSFK